MVKQQTHIEAINNMLDVMKFSTVDDLIVPLRVHSVQQLTYCGKLAYCVDRPVLYINTLVLPQLVKLNEFSTISHTNVITCGNATAIFDVHALQVLWDDVQEAIVHRVMTESFLVCTNNQQDAYLPGVIHCVDLEELASGAKALAIANPDMPTNQKITELNKLLEQEDRLFRVVEPYPTNSTKWGHWRIEQYNK